MDGNVIVQIAVIGAIGLMALGIITMIISGIKSMVQGKQDFRRTAVMAVPFIIFGIGYAVMGDLVLRVEAAGVLTTLTMLGVMVVSVLFTGLRGTFKI